MVNHPRNIRRNGKANKTASTKAVNSFMAFRAFYSSIFLFADSPAQQKEISPFITFLWQSDPFKAAWSVLAKAYSIIRDFKGKSNAKMDEFLALNTSFLGIVSPKMYLETLGFGIVDKAGGGLFLCRVKNPRISQSGKSKSVLDVLHNSIYHNYVPLGVLRHVNEAALASMIAPYPKINTTDSFTDVSNIDYDLEFDLEEALKPVMPPMNEGGGWIFDDDTDFSNLEQIMDADNETVFDPYGDGDPWDVYNIGAMFDPKDFVDL